MHAVMRSRGTIAAIAFVALYCCFSADICQAVISDRSPACPCSDEELCKPIESGGRKEVYGFGGKYWKEYDWDVVTTVAWSSDPELMCFAHSKGVRVVLQASFNASILANDTAQDQWIAEHLQTAQAHFLDGTNFDYEDPIALNSSVRDQYTRLVVKTAEAFHKANPHYQVTLDAAWGPYGIDGRFYDWINIAQAVDFLFVMAYDTRSQIFGPCLASANTPSSVAQLGINQYLGLGIPASKLVLGLPWYGYDYPCLNTTDLKVSKYCPIAEVPFRGVPCSDAAGRERSYGDIWMMLHRSNTSVHGPFYDDLLNSPYFNYRAQDGSIHQMWFDDPDSLALKMTFAKNAGLRGVGFWNYDLLAYNTTDSGAIAATKAMWNATHAFLH